MEETKPAEPVPHDLLFVEGVFKQYRFKYASEKDLQQGIETVLVKHGIPCAREVRLAPGSHLDFLVGDGVGIEVKVDGSNSNVFRQLHRYAEFTQVKSLILYTTRTRHKAGLPLTMRDKPVRAIVLSAF